MEKERKIKECLLISFVFLFIITAIALDLIYYYLPNWWRSGIFSTVFGAARKYGFSYTGSLAALRSNFGILVTALSIIITINVNNLNRSEHKIFGFKQSQFDFLMSQIFYKYGGRLVLAAPFLMIFAVSFGFCILGYVTLVLCYLFLVLAYFIFEKSFSRKTDLKCIARKLQDAVAENTWDCEDIVEYRMLLNIMRQWNDREKYWDGADFLFRQLCDQARNHNVRKMYVLCRYFYEAIYVRDSGNDCERAVYALKEYIIRRDQQKWKEEDYLVLWGMMHCLLESGNKGDVLLFVKWYMDFPRRSRRLGERRDIVKEITEYNYVIPPQVVRMQTGILLVEMELYLCRCTDYTEIDGYIVEKLPQIWNEGKYILCEEWEELRKKYLEMNRLYDLQTEEIHKCLRNLYTDFCFNTKNSMIMYCLNYKQQ